jgi:acetyl esterase/lipase
MLTLILAGALATVSAASAEISERVVPEDRYPPRHMEFAGGRVVGFPDLVYATIPGFRPLHLDLYRPSGETVHPFVVYLHGGGWMNGHTRQSGHLRVGPMYWRRLRRAVM